jgi:biotin operon repressor
MKTRLLTDRLEEKSATTLVTNHLRQRYLFSPVVAEALSDDFQILSHEMDGSSRLGEGQILYPAVKAKEPSGKALKECEYVMVRLTLHARSDLAFQQEQGLKELKKRILHRITCEADAQGGPLTYEDLSRLLFADRKTISRYIRELRAEGHKIVTRANYTDASASISHHRPIVKRFLLNYTESEIAHHLSHTLDRVEGYIKDFLRICIAYRQGYTVEGIRHLTGLSKRVVEKHLAHYVELRDRAVPQKLDQVLV